MRVEITSEIKEKEMDNTNTNPVMPDNTELEKMMKVYLEERSIENLNIVLSGLRFAHLFVPAVFPEGTDLSFMKNIEHGTRFQLPKDVQPVPSILKNAKGEKYLPLYTRKERIPKDQKFHTILEVNFRGSYLVALKEDSKIEGLAINPFDENILLKNALLEKLKAQDDKMIAQQKVINISPEQYFDLLRKGLEFQAIPRMFFADPAKFTDEFCKEKEKFIYDLYVNAFPKKPEAPFEETDFEFMALNVREDLLLIRVDLPEKGLNSGLCHRIYLVWNENAKKAYYFTIEKTPKKEERAMGRVDEDGKRIDCGEAPVEGAEIQRILDIIDEERCEAN